MVLTGAVINGGFVNKTLKETTNTIYMEGYHTISLIESFIYPEAFF